MARIITAFLPGLLSVVSLCFAAEARADQLIVYVYPAPRTIDWRSPNTLAWSTLTGSLSGSSGLRNAHTIGHMNLDLRCAVSATLPHGARVLTGQTSQSDDEEMAEIFQRGYGLNVFLETVPGRWETADEIQADLPARFQRGSIAFMDFQIAPEACARAARYLAEYKQLKFDKIYGGLQHRPRRGEGAGCSAFVESVLEVTGLMDPVWKSYFAHSVYVPNQLLGGPQTGRRVSFLDLLFGFASFSWNGSARGSYTLQFWDPYYAYYWITQAVAKPLLLRTMHYAPVFNQNARGVAIDARKLPVPNDSLWLR